MINNRLFLKRLFFLTKPLIFALVFCSLFMWESEISAVAVEPQITITPRSESAILGDAIVFDYSISGISEYENLYASFSIYKDEGLNNSQSSSNWNLHLSEVSGTFEFKPPFGYGVRATINITDKDGHWYSKDSIIIIFISDDNRVPEIYLPDNLLRIEAESFFDVKATSVYIPKSVTFIDPSAFSIGMTIYTPEGSNAAEWATNHGFKVVYYEKK